MENESADNSQSVKEDLFKRIEKRNEDREQQRSANISERTKNAQENQAILDKVNILHTPLIYILGSANNPSHDRNLRNLLFKFS